MVSLIWTASGPFAQPQIMMAEVIFPRRLKKTVPWRPSSHLVRGDYVGHWEGDRLVVDTIGFNDENWLTAKLGYFHITDLHVVERFTRRGNKMEYQVTVDDPKVLLQPWIWEPRTMALNPDPNAKLPEDYPCSERDVDDTDVR